MIPSFVLDAFSPENLSPLTLWGCFIRIYGLLFTFALAMLYRQVLPHAGSRGLFPIQSRLDRIRADYPNAFERFLRYPTIHWVWSSDRALKNLILGASVAGFLLTVCGVHSRLGFVVMWITYLSFSNQMGFMYPSVKNAQFDMNTDAVWCPAALTSGLLALLLSLFIQVGLPPHGVRFPRDLPS
jgi:hypothetical protein